MATFCAGGKWASANCSPPRGGESMMWKLLMFMSLVMFVWGCAGDARRMRGKKKEPLRGKGLFAESCSGLTCAPSPHPCGRTRSPERGDFFGDAYADRK